MTMRSHSPRSVLNFVEDELPVSSSQGGCHVAGGKRKRPSIPTVEDLTEKRKSSSINLRRHLVCSQTVQWISASTRFHDLEEIRIGPLFESSRAVFAAIHGLPQSLSHLDLDLRNVLHMLPEVFARLFQPDKGHITSLSIRLFGDGGAIELSKWLHRNPNLRKLDLCGNRIGNVGASALMVAIGQHIQKLQVLDLKCNCITDAEPFKKLLLASSSLKQLDISYNWIEDEDTLKLCEGLSANTSLETISIMGCQRLSKRSYVALVDCLREHNMTVRCIQLETRDKSLELQKELHYWLSVNRTGRRLLGTADSAQSPVWPVILAKSNMEASAIFHILVHGGTEILNAES